MNTLLTSQLLLLLLNMLGSLETAAMCRYRLRPGLLGMMLKYAETSPSVPCAPGQLHMPSSADSQQAKPKTYIIQCSVPAHVILVSL